MPESAASTEQVDRVRQARRGMLNWTLNSRTSQEPDLCLFRGCRARATFAGMCREHAELADPEDLRLVGRANGKRCLLHRSGGKRCTNTCPTCKKDWDVREKDADRRRKSGLALRPVSEDVAKAVASVIWPPRGIAAAVGAVVVPSMVGTKNQEDRESGAPAPAGSSGPSGVSAGRQGARGCTAEPPRDEVRTTNPPATSGAERGGCGDVASLPTPLASSEDAGDEETLEVPAERLTTSNDAAAPGERSPHAIQELQAPPADRVVPPCSEAASVSSSPIAPSQGSEVASELSSKEVAVDCRDISPRMWVPVFADDVEARDAKGLCRLGTCSQRAKTRGLCSCSTQRLQRPSRGTFEQFARRPLRESAAEARQETVISTLKAEVRTLQREKTELVDAVAELESKGKRLAQLEEELQKRSDALDTLRECVDALEAANVSLGKALDKSQADLSELKKENIELQFKGDALTAIEAAFVQPASQAPVPPAAVQGATEHAARGRGQASGAGTRLDFHLHLDGQAAGEVHLHLHGAPPGVPASPPLSPRVGERPNPGRQVHAYRWDTQTASACGLPAEGLRFLPPLARLSQVTCPDCLAALADQ